MHFSVGTAQSPHSFPTPLFLHRLIECHTSVFSLSFQLRAGLHHSLDFYTLSRSHLFSTNRLIFVNQPFVVSCPSQRPARPYQGLQEYLQITQAAIQGGTCHPIYLISPNQPIVHCCTNVIWLQYKNRCGRPSSGLQVIDKDNLPMEIFFSCQ